MAAERIGGAFYINLARRSDRRAEVEEELKRIGLSAERFEAIERRPGIVGCGLSHLEVLRTARARGLPNVLVLEDDFQVVVEPAEFWGALEAFFSGPQADDFDVLMLAYYAPAVAAVAGEGQENGLLVKVLEAQTASAYIVNARMYDRLIELYEWAIPELLKTGRHWDFANDQVWKRLQPASNWYAFKKRLGKQRASFSDTAEQFHDYGI
jgi:glycosyl transferase family 25